MATQQQDTGASRGFAFVDFPSVEYAEYFVNSFAGSYGDPDAPQLIIDNRAVQLDYGDSNKSSHSGGPDRGSHHDSGHSGKGGDWLCDKCGCQNFARRTECYRCSVPRPADAQVVQAGAPPAYDEPESDNNPPSSTLVVRGMAYTTTEETVLATFRQYGLVKDARLVRDKVTGASRGFCFVDFHSEEHATHTLRATRDLHLDGVPVKISYARDSFRPERASHKQAHAHAQAELNPYAAAALQAAQWSMANGYGGPVMHGQMDMPGMPPAHMYPPHHPAHAMNPMGAGMPGPMGSMPAGPPPTAPPGMPPMRKPQSIWPPSFEEANAAWHFKAESGTYFYEPLTRFYYETRSKLYYNLNDGRYYRHTPGADPPYQPWDPPEPTGAPPAESKSAEQTAAQASEFSEEPGKKKPITIALKPVKVGATNLKLAKQAQKDIQKWGTVQKEIAQEVEQVNAPPAAGPSDVTTASARKRGLSDAGSEPSGGGGTNDDIKKFKPDKPLTTVTADGVPICLLCKRQFKSVELLQKHEKESKLHLENVAKLAAQQAKPKYRNRAEERRALHGQDAAPRSLWQDVEEGNETAASSSAQVYSNVIPPGQSVDHEENVGNKLLKALGWQEGKGLGKDGSGITAAVGLEGAQLDSVKTGIGAQKPLNIDLSGGNSRENSARAMRARYEQS